MQVSVYLASLWRNSDPFFFTSFLQFGDNLGHTALCDSDMACFRSLSCCMTSFQVSLRCRTNLSEYIWYKVECCLSDWKLPRMCGWQTNSNHHPPSTMFDGWYEVFVVRFLLKMALCMISKDPKRRILFQNLSGFFRGSFANQRSTSIYFSTQAFS